MKTITSNFKKNVTLTIGLLLLSFIGYTQTTQTYNSSGSFNAPAGVTSVQVEAWGGGGRGGSRTSSNGYYGGGGGGAYAKKSVTVSSTGGPYSVTVGAGSSSNATPGEDSYFINTTTVMAKGGSSVPNNTTTGATGGAAGSSVGTLVMSGGNGANGNSTLFYGGGGGSSSGSAAPGNNAVGAVGGIAPLNGGAGGAGRTVSSGNGSAGSAPGGGGGGGFRTSGSATGGNGASGRIVLTWNCVTYSLTTTSISTSICANTAATVTLTGSAASLPVGTYTVTYNQSSPNAITGDTATMTVTTAGTGSFDTNLLANAGTTTVTITKLESGGTAPYNCSSNISTNNTASVTVAAAAVATAGTAITTCSNLGAVNITAGSAATDYTSVNWTSNGTGTFANANSLTTCTYTPSAADIAGSGIITLTLNATGTCGNDTDTKTLTIRKLPTAVAGTAVVTCASGGAVNITAGSSATNSVAVAWTSSGTGSFANATSLTLCTYTPSAADITAGSVTLTLTVTGNSPCANAVDTKTLTINPAPIAVAGTALSTCYGAGAINITAGSSAAFFSTTTWTSSGTGTFANASSLTTCTYNPSNADRIAGSVILTLTATRAGCTNVTATKTLTISSPATAVAGTPVSTCSVSGAVNITAGSSATNYSSIQWTSSGTGTFANANSTSTCTYTPSAADITAGSVSLTLTSYGNSPCANATSSKTLTISQSPTVVAGGALSICSTQTAFNITAGASASNYTTLNWTSSGTGTFTNQTSLTNCTYNPSAADRTAGTVTFTLTATNPGCTNVTDTKVLTITATPVVVAGTPIFTCASTGAVNITAGSSASNYSAIGWTSSGSGTFANATSLTTCTYTPSAADILAGSVTITLNATAYAPCANLSSSKTLTIHSVPTAVAGTAVSTCSTSGSVNITAGSSANNYTSVTWTSSGTGTFSNATSLTTCTYNPSAADIAAGSVTLTLTATNAGCGSDISTKALMIYAMPSITSTNPASRVGPGTVILGATASAGTLYWYAAATGGSPLGFGTTFTTPVISVTTTFYVEAVNGGICTSATRTAVVATVNYPEMDVVGNALSIVDGDTTPSTTDFTDFGSTNMTRTFTIRNTGVGALSLSGITFSGANPSDFSVTTAPNNTIFSGSSTTFVVTFNPSAVGTRTATMSIANNDADEAPYDFTLQGTGVAREIDIQGNATTIVSGDTTPSTADWTDFSTVTATRTFTIRNTGNITLNLGAITITGTNASDFAVTTAPSATVGAYATTTMVVTFTPSAINNRIATINIVNDDSNENPYTFAIQGFGVIPEIDIQGNATSIANNDLTPTTGDWTDFSNTTVTRTFTIFNAGNTALTLGTVVVGGTNASEFTVTTAPSTSVSAFGSTTFVVTFAPTATGTRTATLTISNNDSNENPYVFAIQGTGVNQEMDVLGNAVSIADGDTTPSTTDWTDYTTVALTRTFIIYNSGNMPLTVGTITFSGGNPGDFSVTTAPVSPVPAFGNTTFVITFNPGAAGTRFTNLSIPNNDSNENPYDFRIQGTGGTREINIKSQYNVNIADGDTTPSTSDQTDFGNVSMDGGAVTVNFIIENTGTGAMSIGAYSFTGANAADFTVTSAPSATIAAGGNSRFKITFTPTTKGLKTATFSIVNNDSDENPYNFDLAGTGVQTYQDTDADGVTDNKDLDDDNDGIIDTQEQTDGLSYPLTSLVQYTFLNETFGAGTTKGLININTPGATCTYCYEDGYGSVCDASKTLEDGEYVVTYKITGSVASDPENIHGDLAWYDGLDHTPSDTNGRMAVFNASYAAGTFYETRIDGVIPNVPISYSFYVLNIMRSSNFVGSILPNITVEFVDLNNNLLSSFNTGNIGRCTTASSSDNSCSQSQWLPFSTSVNLGNITSFIVRFKNNSTGGGGNDLAIDDINIVQNYIDTDGDGIANIFDLDDENDGIADVEEAGFKQYSNGLSKMDTSGPSTWADTDANGLHDTIDAQISGGTYLIADTDGDGVPNYLDLDSDNDSLFDVDEANTLNGDGDINGDGKGDLVDTDKDGILDLYDNAVGFGTTARAFAQDTDGDTVADYFDIDSDNDGTKDIQTYLYASLDANNDGKIDGSTDVDKDGILDAFDTNTSVIGSPRDLDRKLYLDFDGRNDYGQATGVLGGLANATLMAWFDLSSSFAAEGVLVGQDKFQIRVSSARTIEVVANTTTLSYSTAALNTRQWYHVGAVYGGGLLKLYLNGEMVASVAASGNIAADASPLTIGKNPVSNTKYFNGRVDEIRVFNVALNDSQFKRMVYQEIQNSSAQVRGLIVPQDVGNLLFSNVLRYYRMDAYKDDIVDDLTTASIDSGSGMKIYNNKYIRVQQAPMPFVTERTGDFATAVNSPTNDVRGLDIMEHDCSIVQVKHNITEPNNNVDLGMLVDAGVTISASNDNKMQNDWYLLLNGKIDLVGRSQLVQTRYSVLDVASAGAIERDQKGQSNKFNYNYWSSPVGSLGTTSNNNPFTVNGVLRDGTNPNSIQPINWVAGYNGAPTSPISLSNYWIFKFQNLTPQYANWSSVGPNGTLQAAQGYTMKGPDSATATQNYTFVGKPNNGLITTPIAAGNANLSGNPYASAIDIEEFIKMNTSGWPQTVSNSITGTLYFWEHYSTNSSHNLLDYQGGYAARNLTGGTVPVSPAGVSGLGSSTRVPARYIPVGQGFLVYGSTTGGNVTFDNSQRSFVKEDNASSNVMFRHATGPVAAVFNNDDDPVTDTDAFGRIRIGFNAAGYHRQLLLGFMEEHATADFDPGYDAPQIDNQPNEMVFLDASRGYNLVIQGDGYFTDDKVYPLGVKVNQQGEVNFTLDNIENFDENQEIYIYDAVTETYNDIRNEAYHVTLPVGSVNDRFSLRFKDPALLANEQFATNEEVTIRFTNADNMLTMVNKKTDMNILTVDLYNILGQSIDTWNVENENQEKIQIPVENVSTGTYIVKVHTTNGDISKKIIIQ